MRTKKQLYPDFTAEIEYLRENGVDQFILHKIIQKHRGNARYNRALYKRYMVLDNALPIFKRTPRFQQENPINNKLNDDFFGEIIDFKTGYFAGKPITYSYSKGEEAQKETGGEEAVKAAAQAVTDFTTRNNMYGCDMEITKFASMCGYAGRLMYIDTDGNERCMPVPAHECIFLSETQNICEPSFALRYYRTEDINGAKRWDVEFYDNAQIHSFKGQLNALEETEVKPHLFDYCPFQGIANNREMLGDAEKVLTLIDDYDKVLSDNSNEVEAFVHAYLIFEGLRIDDETIAKGQKSGSFVIPATGTQQGKAYFLTKNINDAFTEHHLERLEKLIYRFSRTPNLSDESFGSASGISLKFKLHGLETKCGMFQAKMMDAANYMWKVLASAWRKKTITVNPLHVTMDFKRNFPLDIQNEAAAAQTLIAAGLPKEFVYSQLSFVDDVDAIMEAIEEEKESTEDYYKEAADKIKNAIRKKGGEEADENEENDEEKKPDEQKKKKQVI